MEINNKPKQNNYLLTGNKETCYGCGACEKVCPVGAIEMKPDEKGFFYPALDKAKCIQCGKCRNICIYHMPCQDREHTLYALQNKSHDVLECCQSGGAFDAFSEKVLDNGGKVYGSVILDDLSVCHIAADSKSVRNRMRGSKYTKSNITRDCILNLETDLKLGKDVLFTGTPCQCAMVNALFGHFQNLITMEFICHGTPSQILWKDYITWFENKMSLTVDSVFFRIQMWKSKGLHTTLLTDTAGKDYFNSDFSALFYSHLGHRECCFDCKYANKNRQADITIGGFLDTGYYKAFNNGYSVSMCIINTDKGKKAFEAIQDSVQIEEVAYDKEFKQQPCLYAPIAKPKEYESFWDSYEHGQFEKVMQYVPKELYQKYHLVVPGGGGNYCFAG